MDATELHDLFRVQVKDQVGPPYMWESSEIYTYLDDAQKMFCRLTDGISDGTSNAVVNITVTQNAEWLNLHPAILKIRGMTRGSDGAPVDVLNYEDLAERGLRFDGRSAPLRAVIIGMEENKLRLTHKAFQADSLKLLVFRLPLAPLEKGAALEIPEQHHLHLLPWAKSLAYMKHDTETFDEVKATDLANTFRAYCADVKAEQGKKRHKPRTVAYGGL